MLPVESHVCWGTLQCVECHQCTLCGLILQKTLNGESRPCVGETRILKSLGESDTLDFPVYRTGRMPPELGDLDALQGLNLSENELSGEFNVPVP